MNKNRSKVYEFIDSFDPDLQIQMYKAFKAREAEMKLLILAQARIEKTTAGIKHERKMVSNYLLQLQIDLVSETDPTKVKTLKLTIQRIRNTQLTLY